MLHLLILYHNLVSASFLQQTEREVSAEEVAAAESEVAAINDEVTAITSYVRDSLPSQLLRNLV